MSQPAAELPAVSRAQLERVMRHAVGSSTAQLGEWEWHSLAYHTVLPDRILARATGVALVDRQARGSVVQRRQDHSSDGGRRAW